VGREGKGTTEDGKEDTADREAGSAVEEGENIYPASAFRKQIRKTDQRGVSF
jgi:hypothetical protein